MSSEDQFPTRATAERETSSVVIQEASFDDVPFLSVLEAEYGFILFSISFLFANCINRNLVS